MMARIEQDHRWWIKVVFDQFIAGGLTLILSSTSLLFSIADKFGSILYTSTSEKWRKVILGGEWTGRSESRRERLSLLPEPNSPNLKHFNRSTLTKKWMFRVKRDSSYQFVSFERKFGIHRTYWKLDENSSLFWRMPMLICLKVCNTWKKRIVISGLRSRRKNPIKVSGGSACW